MLQELKEAVLKLNDTAEAMQLSLRFHMHNESDRWMVDSLDGEAKRLGISRQAVIKFWIAEKLEAYRS